MGVFLWTPVSNELLNIIDWKGQEAPRLRLLAWRRTLDLYVTRDESVTVGADVQFNHRN